ncbi:ERMES complex subunit mmm1 [Malassezia cuniculi]|uniref:Maintenance of mitochondrial morphology protein 1 n=1 Tax=Malassezia cuniculi TaxID=948313 RepID=A0AAF0J7R8_9BASI|nr:ERMES complex subunit mmm1 [Malassezia cuniculi]
MSFGPQTPSGPTFFQGFIVGQLVFLVGLVFLFRYFYVADVPQSLEQQRKQLIERTVAQQKSLAARSTASKPQGSPYCLNSLYDVLARNGYDVSVHPPESLDWLNVIVASAIASYRTSIVSAAGSVQSDPNAPLPSLQSPEKAAVKKLLEHAMNTAVSGRTFNLLDYITVTDIDFGCQFPQFRNARIQPDETGDCARLQIDFDYVDQISIGIDTRLLMNFSQLRFGSLALAMTLRIERISGTFGVEIGPRRATNTRTPEIRVSIYPDFVLQAHLSSIIGSKDKLQDVPKIEEILITRMRMFIVQHLVWPKCWSIPLPGV